MICLYVICTVINCNILYVPKFCVIIKKYARGFYSNPFAMFPVQPVVFWETANLWPKCKNRVFVPQTFSWSNALNYKLTFIIGQRPQGHCFESSAQYVITAGHCVWVWHQGQPPCDASNTEVWKQPTI